MNPSIGRLWILIAHESGARVFSRNDPLSPLELVMRIDRPIGRAKARELTSDRPGREEEWGPSGAHHAFGKHVTPPEKSAIDFARELADSLNRDGELNEFEHLILVAGPKFLGYLWEHLSKQTAMKVVAKVHQNLGTLKDRDIPDHLVDTILRFDRDYGLREYGKVLR